MTINPVRYALHTTACLALLTVVSVTLPNANVAFGQAGSKDTQKFQSLVDSTRGSLEKARAQFDTAMGAYNVIANSETDDPEKAYKNLTKQVSTSEKDWKSASKNFNNIFGLYDVEYKRRLKPNDFGFFPESTIETHTTSVNNI